MEDVRPAAGAAVLEWFSGLGEGRGPAAAALLSRLFAADVSAPEAQSELKYSIKRLIRGTASNRQTAREGYFSVLSILLRGREDISINDILTVLNEELQIGGQSKSEAGEICIGRVLVCGAIIRSGLFLRSNDDERSKAIAALLDAGGKRAYLGLAAYAFLSDFIKEHTEEQVRSMLWPYIKENLSRPIDEHTLDSLYCLFVICERCPAIAKKLYKKKLEIKSLICEETVQKISDKLMNIPEFAYMNHPIYEIFAKELAKSDHLMLFWTEGLESKLGLNNENRVLIVLTILATILKNIGENTKLIPQLLSEKFLPCILEWFKGFQSAIQTGKRPRYKGKQTFYAHENRGRQIMIKAKEVFDIIIDVLKPDTVESETKLEVLKKLLFYPGDIMFCDITNTKIIKILIENLKADSIHSFAHILKKVITNETKKSQDGSSERAWTNSERLRAAEMLTYLINHKTTVDDVKWRIKNMQFLIRISLFRPVENEDSYVSIELAVAVKKCFFRCLTSRLPKLETLLTILSSIVKYIDENISNPQVIKDNTKLFSPQVLECWKSMIDFTTVLENCNKNVTSKVHTVFQILAFHTGLFLFSDVMTADMAENSLKEVKSCYDHYADDSKKKKKKKNRADLQEGDIVDDEPDWTEVLVDVFLSFLSRDSGLLRNVVQCVFRLLCEFLTPSAIGQIVSVLDPDDESNLLSYKDDQDDENESDVSEDEEADDSINIDEEKESDKDISSGSEEEENDPDDHTTVNDQLRLAVQKALGNAAPETDTESIDIDNIDEDEGKKIDDALSSAFRMLKQSKGELSKKEKKNIKILMEFRIRVLDLIHIYLEKVPSMEICLSMLSPLFKCLEFAIKDSLQKQLEDKVRKCLKCLTGVRTFTSTDGVTVDLLADYLKSITGRGSRTQFVFQALGDVISKCSSFLVRCALKLPVPETPSKKKKKQKTADMPIVNIYKELLEAFFTKRDCLLPVIFFHEIIQLKWSGNWILLDTIIEKTFDNSVRQFRKNEGLEMINLFYTNLRRNLKADLNQDITTNLQTIEEVFSSKLIAYLNNCNENNSSVNERFFTILMKALASIKGYHNSTPCKADNMNWDMMIRTLQESRKRIKLRNTQEYFKFCNLIGAEKIKNSIKSNMIATNNKELVDSGHDSNTDGDSATEESGDVQKQKQNRLLLNGHTAKNDSNANSNSKMKKKKSAKNLSKKESKQLRMMASSEGLQDVSFTTLLKNSNIDINDITEEPEEDVQKSTKRKKDEDHIGSQKSKKSKTLDKAIAV